MRRFFRKEDHVYRIDKTIREMCIFARQNVTADPPFSHLDLISCRNVMIYLSTPLQKRVLSTFHYALNAPGFLVLGTAESVGETSDLFELVDRTHKIYAKKATVSRPLILFPPEAYKRVLAVPDRRTVLLNPTPLDFQKEADRFLLSRYAPPGVLVNDNLDILQFRGRTSAYLEAPPGEPTTNLLKMAREGLFLDLRNALAEAKKHNQPVQRDGVRVRVDGGTRTIRLEVLPIRPVSTGDVCYLVLFHDVPGDLAPPDPIRLAVDEAAPAPAADATPEANGDERELVQLRQELAPPRNTCSP